MADPRFFAVKGPFTLTELAVVSGAEIGPNSAAGAQFFDVAQLDTAGPREISFLDNRKYVGSFENTKAGAVIIDADFSDRAPPGTMLLLTKDPYRAYAKIAQAFYPTLEMMASIAPSAFVSPSAILGDGCCVEHGAYIGDNAEIGRGCFIGVNAVIGVGVVLGDGCIVGSNSSVSHSIVGSRVTIYPGARIGQDGFGFAMGPQGYLKIPQLGRVIVGDDVEIGANTTIDRGSGPDTVIGAGCMIDNLVQIGHNVQLGRGCVLAAQVGISGSTRLGDFVVVGGQAGFSGHLKIGAGVRVAAKGGVIRDVSPGSTIGGCPAVPMTEWLRQSALLSKQARRKG